MSRIRLFLLASLIILSPLITLCQVPETNSQQQEKEKNKQIPKDTLRKTLNEVNINALKATNTTPVAFTNINKNEIEKANLGQDITYIMSFTPSVVTTSDAGAGIGYTGLRIRGSDQTRINVTVNGIPINDSESQGVWWVNMPDLSSSTQDIQIQRGVGTSTNGGSAFGATINLNTTNFSKDAYTTTNNTIGSYNTIKNNIEFGTGLINNKFSFDGRLSKINSDGYMDRAFSKLKSLYLQGSYFNEKSVIKGLVFSGKERTYQSWYGVPLNYLDSNRTYNPYTYKNEVDNYMQTHYQIHYNKNVSKKTNFNLSFHYTRGKGYYEQEKTNESLSDYGLENVILINDTITSTDLIRRKWLSNHFKGLVYSLNHKINDMNITIGGSNNKYDGDHFGNVIWMKHASNANYNYEYYSNTGVKIDNNLYAKINYDYSNSTNIYFDLQSRSVNYEFVGYDENGNLADQEVDLSFLNPKFGFSHFLNTNKRLYASYAVGNKEPSRNDYIESSPNSRPKAETLHDLELGYRQVDNKLSFGINFYRMDYDNQLVLTGQINDVGAYTRQNIEESFRQGVEIDAVYKFSNKFKWGGNITLSSNKISNYTEFIDNWDTWGQESIEHTDVDLAFSPNLIWASFFDVSVQKNLKLELLTKYVGKQFIDNTSSNDRALDEYMVNTLRLSYDLKTNLFKTAKIILQINNLLDTEYVSNAWVYRFVSDNYDPRGDDPYVNSDTVRGYNMAAYFPEAQRNFLVSLKLGM